MAIAEALVDERAETGLSVCGRMKMQLSLAKYGTHLRHLENYFWPNISNIKVEPVTEMH